MVEILVTLPVNTFGVALNALQGGPALTQSQAATMAGNIRQTAASAMRTRIAICTARSTLRTMTTTSLAPSHPAVPISSISSLALASFERPMYCPARQGDVFAATQEFSRSSPHVPDYSFCVQ